MIRCGRRCPRSRRSSTKTTCESQGRSCCAPSARGCVQACSLTAGAQHCNVDGHVLHPVLLRWHAIRGLKPLRCRLLSEDAEPAQAVVAPAAVAPDAATAAPGAATAAAAAAAGPTSAGQSPGAGCAPAKASGGAAQDPKGGSGGSGPSGQVPRSANIAAQCWGITVHA